MSSRESGLAEVHALFTTTANHLAAATGVIQRQRKLTGAVLLQALVFGWLTHPDATVSQLAETAALCGVVVSPQAIDQRFTPALVTCLERFFAATLTALAGARWTSPRAIPLLQRFTGVWLLDSTSIRLPAAAAARWPGCGGRPGEGLAALKVTTRLDVLYGTCDPLELTAGRLQDRASALQHAALPVGGLRVSDLGYVTLSVFRQIDTTGSFFLSRVPVNVTILTPDGGRIPAVPRWLTTQVRADGTVDTPVLLGLRDRQPVRLLAVPVPDALAAQRRRRLRRRAKKRGEMVSQAALDRAGWTIFITNVPADRLSVAEAVGLYRMRWQIELLFKCWKQDGQLTNWRSANPDRILVEVYAKLIGWWLQHRLLLLGAGVPPQLSLAKAYRVIRDHIRVIAATFDRPAALRHAGHQLAQCLRTATTRPSRHKHPSTAQILLDLPRGHVT